MNLYKINNELDTLLRISQTGEVLEGYEDFYTEEGQVNQEAIEARIQELYSCIDDIIEDTARLAQNLDAEAKAIKAEEERLAARRKTVEGRLEWVEDRVTKLVGGENWNSPKSCLKLTFRSSEALIVDDESQVNSDYIKTKTVTSVDKVAAKNALKKGIDVGGCHIEKRRNLTIK